MSSPIVLSFLLFGIARLGISKIDKNNLNKLLKNSQKLVSLDLESLDKIK